MTQVRIAVDIGGTFTDFVVESPTTRQTFKLLTTPSAPEAAVLAGIDRILASIPPADIASVIHGTTLATNAVIERRIARTAFLTTAGFRDTLEMATEHRYDQYDLLIDRTPPLVPRNLRFTIAERITADGATLTPLDTAAIPALAARMRAANIESLAIGFLHSYRSPAHEQQAARLLAPLLPGTPISLSSDVAPEIREYDRFSTVVANAAIQPLMATYLRALEAGLRARSIAAPLLLIQSNGGLCDLDTATRYPVRLLESGPAGGAIFAASIAAELGLDKTLLLDVGGTTAKLCFIDNQRPQMARSMEVGRVNRFRAGSGLPLRLPVVELCEIGAGGGSLARLDTLGRLQVGPQSAGSSPGPACYGLGGTDPTVTDANLLQSRLDPDNFADGSITLNPTLARNAVAKTIGTPLGIPPADAAAFILAMLNENMANAAREHAIDADRSLPGRVLIGIGGGAALHAADLARILGITRIVIPRDAGVGSAVGFLRAPLAFERALSWPQALDTADLAATRETVAALIAQTIADLKSDTAPITTLTAQMRYRGQGSEITVPIALDDLADKSRLADAFAATYRGLYRRTLASPIEILAWSARSELPFPAANPAAPTTRAGLALGETSSGPALLVDTGTTIVVPQGWTATLTPQGHITLSQTP